MRPHHKIHDLLSSKRCCQTRSVVGRIRDAYKAKKASYSCGQERVKNQPLTTKITRGDFYGKRWFPFWNSNKTR